MTEIVKLEVQVHEDFLKQIDRWIKKRGYEDRGEFIRSALRSHVHEYDVIEVAKSRRKQT